MCYLGRFLLNKGGGFLWHRLLEGKERVELFTPEGCDADKELEVDARHWATENGEVFFVEKVVDSAFERPSSP